MLIKDVAALKNSLQKYKSKDCIIGLVPTMGALHEGHLSLIKAARTTCDTVVVSVFVNPIQFGPNEDYNMYPRTLNVDYELCMKNGVDVVFSPSPIEMYGNNLKLSNECITYVCPPIEYTNKLCGKSRIGHFDGVCTVVNKLFNLVQPDYAFFGQKDAQQLLIIRKMVQDLNIPVNVVECPIIRDSSGLALSSRNKYLSESGKKDAAVLYKILTNIYNHFKMGITDITVLKETALKLLGEGIELEYLEILDSETLKIQDIATEKSQVFIACKVEGIRLIDNLKMGG